MLVHEMEILAVACIILYFKCCDNVTVRRLIDVMKRIVMHFLKHFCL